MLPEAQNRLLTEVSRGKPMGELLRRHWLPIAGASEFDKQPVKPIRLMGEDLVLYKDLGGQYGLIDRQCPHRRADLSYGFVEQNGIRCNYHGWLYNEHGRCTHQPYEETAFPKVNLREKIQMAAYPVRELGGILWAYMGPAPAPELPDWEPFSWKNGFVQIVISEIPCNWFQCQENSIDPVHFEWMHANWSIRLRGQTGPYAPTHLRVEFDEFEHGFRYRRIQEDTDENNSLWTVGRVCLWPNALYTGSHFEWRTPIDDENTLSVTWQFTRVPREREPYVQGSIPTWYGPIKDEIGRWITSHIMNQDFLAWVGQGVIADRTKENLGASDRGIAMIRRRYLSDLEAIARGEDPKAVIRDPALNQAIPLPVADRAALIEGVTMEQQKKRRRTAGYYLQYGQPDWVAKAYEEATGLEGGGIGIV